MSQKSTRIKSVGSVTEALMYMGPGIVEQTSGAVVFMLPFGQIYKNGLPDDIRARMDADVNFRDLFIPVSQVASAAKEFLRGDSPLSLAKSRVAAAYARQRGGK